MMGGKLTKTEWALVGLTGVFLCGLTGAPRLGSGAGGLRRAGDGAGGGSGGI